MFKSLLATLLRSLGATVIEKGSSALVDKLAPKDGEDFSEAPKVRAKRKLPQIYADEMAKLLAMEITNVPANESERRRFDQAFQTQKARVAMYKARLDAQAPTV